MDIRYENEELEAFIKYGLATKNPYKRWKSNKQLMVSLQETVRILEIVDNCGELLFYRRLNYEKLKYERQGQSSVRVGYKSKFRLIFIECDEGVLIKIIELSEHYGDK